MDFYRLKFYRLKCYHLKTTPLLYYHWLDLFYKLFTTRVCRPNLYTCSLELAGTRQLKSTVYAQNRGETCNFSLYCHVLSFFFSLQNFGGQCIRSLWKKLGGGLQCWWMRAENHSVLYRGISNEITKGFCHFISCFGHFFKVRKWRAGFEHANSSNCNCNKGKQDAVKWLPFFFPYQLQRGKGWSSPFRVRTTVLILSQPVAKYIANLSVAMRGLTLQLLPEHRWSRFRPGFPAVRIHPLLWKIWCGEIKDGNSEHCVVWSITFHMHLQIVA